MITKAEEEIDSTIKLPERPLLKKEQPEKMPICDSLDEITTTKAEI